MTAKESLNHDYGRLAGFLRGISLRFQLLATLEFLFYCPPDSFLVLLGSFFALELKKAISLSSLYLFPRFDPLPVLPSVIGHMADRLQAFHGSGGEKSGRNVSSAQG